MDLQSDETKYYLYKKTGEVVLITEEELRLAEDEEPLEDLADWEQKNLKIAKEILETDNYLPLPDRFEINEYGIMERFCLSIKDKEVRDLMSNSIKGSGAFRRFKEDIRRCNLLDDWNKYRDTAIRELVIEWCEDNDVEYAEE